MTTTADIGNAINKLPEVVSANGTRRPDVMIASGARFGATIDSARTQAVRLGGTAS